MKRSHRLQASVILQPCGDAHQHAGRGEKQAEWNQCAGQSAEDGRDASRRSRGNPPQQGEGSKDSGPLIPRPVANKEVGAREQSIPGRTLRGMEWKQEWKT